MPEDNQIQTGFQPEIQANLQIQQNNLVQNQQIIQQNNSESTEKGLPQNLRSSSSRSNKILGWLFIFLGLILNGFGIYAMYCQISDGYNSIGDVFTNSLVSFPILAGVCFTIIGIKNLFHGQKSHASWLVKIVSCIFGLLGITLIGLGIYGIFETQSDRHYSDYTIRDIIMDSGIFILGPLGIWLIILGILSYRTPNVDIYYHPTRLNKILSGIYRFVGIALIRAGLWNFSLIGTEDLSFFKIVYVGGIITICGILYILLGRLLYSTKNRIHLGFSLLLSLTVNIMFARILRIFTKNSGIDSDILEHIGVIIVLFSLIYFSISTIRWIIKCRKFKKKGIINPKYLDSTPSKKKVGIIVTIILISIVVIDLIYGKIQWSKIPEVDKSIFTREKHQIQLPDEEDALIQLKNFNDGNMYNIFNPLDSYYLYEQNSSYDSDNKDISWKQHTNECIIINSGGNEYCGTWAWNKKTLDRVLNNYYYIGDNSYFKNLIDANGYLSIDGKKVTIFEYIDKKEPEIKSDLQKLDEILSLDYYLDFSSPIDNPDYLLPQFLQGYTRSSMVVLQYYTLKKDWDMVMFIIQLQYKMIDILNNFGGTISHLISFVIQNITDSTINQLVKAFPNDFRVKLSEQYSNLDYNKEWMLNERTKGEYNNTRKNRAKDVIFMDVGSNIPSLTQFLFHFPFFSKKDSNHFMEYAYYNLMYNEEFDFDNFLMQLNLPKNSLYNYYGTYPYLAIRPRTQGYNNRLANTLFHKEILIKNLKSGRYDARFSEKDWDSYEYERNRISTDNELNK